MAKQYIDFDPSKGYPTGPDLYYECQKCHKILPSWPPDNMHCDCYNLFIDVEAGRIAIEDITKVKLLRIDSEQPQS